METISLQERLRSAIDSWDLSLNVLAHNADVGYEELRKFNLRRGSVSIATAEKLFGSLGLEVIAGGIEAALRAAIETDARTRRKLARDAGVNHLTIWRLMGGKGVSLDTADKIFAVLRRVPDLVGDQKAVARDKMITGEMPISAAIRPLLASIAEQSDDMLRRIGIEPFQLRQLAAGNLDVRLTTATRIMQMLGFSLKLGRPAEGWVPRALHIELREMIIASGVAINRISRLSGVAFQTIRGFVDARFDIRLSTADRITSSLATAVTLVPAAAPISIDHAEDSAQYRSLASEVRERFKASGVSRNSVATKAGLAGPTVGRFMAGTHVRIDTLTKIADAIGLNLNTASFQASPADVTQDSIETELAKLTTKRARVVRALIDAEPTGMTGATIHSTTQVASWWKILEAIEKSSPFWKDKVLFPKAGGKRYRVKIN